jgi:hypothetical protein
MKGITKQNTCLENSGILEKGENQIMIKTKAKKTKVWKAQMTFFDSLLNSTDSKIVVMGKKAKKEYLELYHESGTKRTNESKYITALSDGTEIGKLVLKGLNSEAQKEFKTEYQSVKDSCSKMNKIMLDNNVRTIKSKNGDKKAECIPNVSVKLDNDNERRIIPFTETE